MQEMEGPALNMSQHLRSAHFLQSTFENWESEFLQMALLLLLSMFLYLKGSSESKDPDKEEVVDREPNPRRKDVAWPVKKEALFPLSTSTRYVTHWFYFFCYPFCCTGTVVLNQRRAAVKRKTYGNRFGIPKQFQIVV